MAITPRPKTTTRSEHWLRVAVNDKQRLLDALIISAFDWDFKEQIEWLSPLKNDKYSEYSDNEFLIRLGLKLKNLQLPLNKFWPARGPHWDGLGRTQSGKLLLVEAKAYPEEAVDYGTKAKSGTSLKMIKTALEDTKKAFKAPKNAPWGGPFYQYANRLAHLRYLSSLNNLDAYLLFLYFAEAPDVPYPATESQWIGAIRTTEKCLGIGRHPFQARVRSLVLKVPGNLY